MTQASLTQTFHNEITNKKYGRIVLGTGGKKLRVRLALMFPLTKAPAAGPM
jgi:hypothetical protein